MAIRLADNNKKLKFKLNIYDIIAFLFTTTMFEIWGRFRVPVELICIVCFLLKQLYSKRTLRLNLANPYYMWCFTFLFVCGISSIGSEQVVHALLGVRMFLETVLAGVSIGYYINSQERLVKILKYIVIAAVLYFIKILLTVPIENMLSRQFATGLNANTVGMKLAISLIITIWLYKEKVISLWQMALLLLLLSPMIVITGSKKAIFVLVFSILFLLLLYQRNIGKIVLYIFAALCAVYLVYYLIMNNEFLYSTVGHRIQGLLNAILYGYDEGDRSTRGRITLIEIGIRYWKKKPILGYGINTYSHIVGIMGSGGRFLYSHCNYVEVLFGTGIIGAIIYYSIFPRLILKQLKSFKQNRFQKLFLSLCITILILDVGMVSYLDEFTQVIIMLSCAAYLLEDNRLRTESIKIL